MDNNMTFSQWFDPYNVDHIGAYSTLKITGCWPIGFIPPGIIMNPDWISKITYKLATTWVTEILLKNQSENIVNDIRTPHTPSHLIPSDPPENTEIMYAIGEDMRREPSTREEYGMWDGPTLDVAELLEREGQSRHSRILQLNPNGQTIPLYSWNAMSWSPISEVLK